eukprot:scaffold3115_cov234-Pinguiococcus_pyrenoidosus.AAC.3
MRERRKERKRENERRDLRKECRTEQQIASTTTSNTDSVANTLPLWPRFLQVHKPPREALGGPLLADIGWKKRSKVRHLQRCQPRRRGPKQGKSRTETMEVAD